MAAIDDDGVGRREFLGSAALTTAGAVTAGISAYHFSTREPEKAPDVSGRTNDPVKLGFIGVGRRGGALLRSALKVPGNQVVAVCDVQESARNAAVSDIVGKGDRSAVKTYEDYHDLLADANIAAVVIATPQYLHGQMALDALEAGKHIYC